MGFRTRVTALLASLLVSAGGAVSAPAATAQEVASGTGPALTVDEASLDRSLNYHDDLADSDRNTVIPLHGTTANVEANWSWTWEPALAENVTHAIRTVYAESGRKVDLVGHSQGGMIGRWTTKWWPDTRAMVANMVGLGSSNNGSDMISLTCTVACPEAMRQQSSGSDFLTALNEGGDTYPGIRYTTIATRFDEVVAPYDKAFLPPADNVRNIILQDQCPGEPVEHFLLAASNPVWELAVQALDGNPDPRVDPSACQKIMPGVDVAQIPTGLPSTVGTIVGALAGSPWTAAEPPVADFAR
ncbi:esterase/lipase family protein [Corynebacterium variabile]|uniref:esterase/lipase family protein n=1 Tax=Corynebacterium variabile TaxID=1727 RepID=UPI0028A1CD0A|nr:triacylglycerol lipase [Corynebacterium variabile]